jgi:lipid A 3-O-deacylase
MFGWRVGVVKSLAPAALAAATALLPATAAAQVKLVDELKIGGMAHDVSFLGTHVERGADLNLEILFPSPELLRYIGSPRPHIGGDINTSGNTSYGYFGLTWGIMLIQNLFGNGGGVFLNGSFGGAVHNGYTDNAPPGRKNLGSPILFHGGLELGYQVTPVVSVSAILDHISNANLASHNAGITNAGARIGFRF